MNLEGKLTKHNHSKPKEIKQDLVINKGAMKTHVKLDLDGKTIMDEDGHSILAGFAQELYLGMRSMTETLTTIPKTLYPSLVPVHITSAETYSSGTKTKLNYENGYGEYVGSGYSLTIWGTGTALDGNAYVINTGSATSNYIIIDTAWSAGYSSISDGYGYHVFNTNADVIASYRTAISMYVRFGMNANAVAITDDVPQVIPQLTHGGTTYSVVTPDADNDRVDLIFTMTATNNTANTITVYDVNMIRHMRYSGADAAGMYLFARDVLTAPVAIAAGGSLTATYTIRTTTDLASDNTGGFTQRLLELLRGTIVDTNVLDVGNTTRTTSFAGIGEANYPLFSAIHMPRNLPERTSNTANTTAAWKFGIILGTGTTEPDLTDYYIATAIEDGAGSGQLKYWAGIVEGYTETATTRSFNVVRIVENSSGAPIVVSELGLGVCIAGAVSNRLYSALIARHVLSAAAPDNRITIADGEFCKITYTITIEV